MLSRHCRNTSLAGFLLALVPVAHASFIVTTIADVGSGSPEGTASYNINGAGATIDAVGMGASASGTTDPTGLLSSAHDTAAVDNNVNLGSASASADLATASLHTFATNTQGQLNVTAGASFQDTLHFFNPAGTPFFVGLGFLSDGDLSVAAPSAGGAVNTDFTVSTDSSRSETFVAILDGGSQFGCPTDFVPCFPTEFDRGWTGGFFSSDIPGKVIFSGFVSLSGTHPFMTIGLSSNLILTGAPATFDYGQTTSVQLSLPDGVTFTSDSGVFDQDLTPTMPAQAPEPAGIALLGAGLLLIAATSRKFGRS